MLMMQDVSVATGLSAVALTASSKAHAVFSCQSHATPAGASEPLQTVKVVYMERCSDKVVLTFAFAASKRGVA
jgi:hypothetical protein